MTLNIAQVRERVAKRFSDFEQVDDSVIRFTKKDGDQPFAVCYLDVAQDLPGTPEMLTKYQDRVIGRHYFEGGKSLQWNNYLYFITTPFSLSSSFPILTYTQTYVFLRNRAHLSVQTLHSVLSTYER